MFCKVKEFLNKMSPILKKSSCILSGFFHIIMNQSSEYFGNYVNSHMSEELPADSFKKEACFETQIYLPKLRKNSVN